MTSLHPGSGGRAMFEVARIDSLPLLALKLFL